MEYTCTKSSEVSIYIPYGLLPLVHNELVYNLWAALGICCGQESEGCAQGFVSRGGRASVMTGAISYAHVVNVLIGIPQGMRPSRKHFGNTWTRYIEKTDN